MQVLDVVAERGKLHGAGEELQQPGQVADGRADAYWGPGLQPWDGAAGALIVSEAGGTVGDLDGANGGDWPPTGNVLAAVPVLWDPLLEILRDVYR